MMKKTEAYDFMAKRIPMCHISDTSKGVYYVNGNVVDTEGYVYPMSAYWYNRRASEFDDGWIEFARNE